MEKIQIDREEFFRVNVKKYSSDCDFEVIRPASLDFPKDNAVMFVKEAYLEKWKNLLRVKHCLVFWPINIDVPCELRECHAVFLCPDTRVAYCQFFKENQIRNLPEPEKMNCVNGAYIAESAKIGQGTVIMPGAYISGKTQIGENCYIGAGTKLMGRIIIGNSVIIRENSVLGADGLSTDRNEDGSAATMPQFGGILVENSVEIGANCVIARGAIDNTVIGTGCKLDNSVFISHNVLLGKDTFVVGETIMFGSSSTGERTCISGNATIRNKVKIGSDVIIGMGSVVTKDIESGSVVLGSPAKKRGQ